MDPASLSLRARVLMACLLAAARCPAADSNHCPEVPPRPLTKPPPVKSYEIDSRFRYECIEGYTRQAGTSNLIVCVSGAAGPVWTSSNLVCIPIPTVPKVEKSPATESPLPTIQQMNISASMSTNTESTPSASDSVTVAMTTAQTSSTSTFPHVASTQKYETQVNSRTAMAASVASVLIFSVIGISLFCIWRVKHRKPLRKTKEEEEEEIEEEIPMNQPPP